MLMELTLARRDSCRCEFLIQNTRCCREINVVLAPGHRELLVFLGTGQYTGRTETCLCGLPSLLLLFLCLNGCREGQALSFSYMWGPLLIVCILPILFILGTSSLVTSTLTNYHIQSTETHLCPPGLFKLSGHIC